MKDTASVSTVPTPGPAFSVRQPSQANLIPVGSDYCLLLQVPVLGSSSVGMPKSQPRMETVCFHRTHVLVSVRGTEYRQTNHKPRYVGPMGNERARHGASPKVPREGLRSQGGP